MKTIVIALLFAATGLGTFYYFNSYRNSDTVVVPTPVTEITETPDEVLPPTVAPTQIAIFENTDYDFTFKYRIKPYGHSVFENTLEQNIDMGTLFGVTLMRSDDYNESVKAAAEGNAHDGPPAMSVYVYSASKVLSLEDWLTDNKTVTSCAVGEVTNTVLGGSDALVCLWDGLYLGITIAQIRDNKIYLLIGTREEGETVGGFSYKKDFDEVVKSYKLTTS